MYPSCFAASRNTCQLFILKYMASFSFSAVIFTTSITQIPVVDWATQSERLIQIIPRDNKGKSSLHVVILFIVNVFINGFRKKKCYHKS